jgi:GAF domain
MPRISVHPRYLQEVHSAWRRKREECEQNLAGQLGQSLPIVIVNLFLKGEPVNRVNFIKICQLLELDWQKMAGLKESAEQEAIAKLGTVNEMDKAINELVATLCEMLRRITRKAGSLLNADRTSIFLLDRQTNVLGTIVADDGAGGFLMIDIPADRGIASLAATSLEIVNVPFDVYDDPRSEEAKNTDQKTGYRTYTILAWPLLNKQQDLIAVVQLINKLQPGNNPETALSQRIDKNGFSKDDEAKIAKFAPSILKILEKCQFCYQLSLKLRKNADRNQWGNNSQNAAIIIELKRREQQLRKSLNKI